MNGWMDGWINQYLLVVIVIMAVVEVVVEATRANVAKGDFFLFMYSMYVPK